MAIVRITLDFNNFREIDGVFLLNPFSDRPAGSLQIQILRSVLLNFSFHRYLLRKHLLCKQSQKTNQEGIDFEKRKRKEIIHLKEIMTKK